MSTSAQVPGDGDSGYGVQGLLMGFWLCNRVPATFIGVLLLTACASQTSVPDTMLPTSVESRTVALLGATGMVGGYLLQEALARGHRVRALARNPAKLSVYGDRVDIVQGDARDAAVVQKLIRGSDVVITALGPVRADGDAARSISTDATANVLRAMGLAGVSRYLVVSGAAVEMSQDDRKLLGWWVRFLVQVGLRETLRDKQAEYALLLASPVDWTLVRCPLIDPAPYRYPPLVSLETPPAFRLRAGELARFVIGQIERDEFVRQGPFLGSRPLH
ncbi:MAG: NAD(P)H-binding protein [Halioglobus sp.]|nr:NAD(P)H-binding protein [Halioglobus sp.]